MKDKKVVFLIGTTATGKTQVALEQAKKLSSSLHVVNADSVQVYKRLNIGTDKPSLEDRKICPHFLFDHVDFPEEYNISGFYKDALSVLSKQNGIFIFVGGSGFYFSALEHGLYPHSETPKAITQKYIQIEKEKGLPFLFQELCKRDKIYAQKIKAQDSYRIVRALSIIESSGKTLSSIQNEFQKNKPVFPYPLYKIGLFLTKEELKQKIIKRVDRMLDLGLVSEVERLLEQGLKNWRPMNSVGYKEVCMFLNKEVNLTEMKKLIVKNTLSLAKRQRTWFKRDKLIKWFHAIHDKEKINYFFKSFY